MAMRAQGATLAGSILGGVLASACCLGPLVLSLLGVSGAAFAQRFEPLRPYLLVLTYGLLAGAFHLAYRPAPAACAPGEACDRPRTSRAGRIALWIGAVVVVLSTLFPFYSRFLF
jgi:mercuric ion transport protein